MGTEEELVEGLRDTLDMREAADALIAQADATEATIDAEITERGYDAAELMEKAYFS